MRTLISTSVFFGLLAVSPALAQGTGSQRAACESDAQRLCSAAIPDAIAVERCLAANARALSRACRKQFMGKGRR
jgi:hypothetical protein